MNRAARSEAHTKVAHHAILIDRVTRDRLGERIKGKMANVDVFAVDPTKTLNA